MKKICALVTAAVLLLALLPLPVRAEPTPGRTKIGREDHGFVEMPSSFYASQPSINSKAAILVDLGTGTILFEKNIHQQKYPASTTKVMTALLALEKLELDDTLTVSYNATHDLISGGFDWRFQAGQVFTIEEALYGLCLASVNTLGYALAEEISGDVPTFAALMNERAAAAGALNTHFTNPHGLNDMNHLTTVYDMAKILWAAVELDDYRRIAGTDYYSCAEPKNGQVMNFSHTLSFVHPSNKWYDPRVVCGKTGWTEDANLCRAIYATDGNRHLICIVYDFTGDQDYIESDVETLLDYGFSFDEASLASLQTSYTLRNGVLSGVQPGTVASQLRARISLQTAGSWVLTDAQGVEKSGSSLIRTGDKIWVYAPNGVLRYSVEIVIYGDVNGDGIIDIFDLVGIRNHIIAIKDLQDSAFRAGDVNRDGSVDIFDLVGIRNHIIEYSLIEQ
ncbi:MAG: D-alanyl-D-alanine carboxypeptidase [Lachnospiraceae bacterium]|nr:D-alanyl-D-alanine carboxypeptidase [Lachnospiraceae bacterium]